MRDQQQAPSAGASGQGSLNLFGTVDNEQFTNKKEEKQPKCGESLKPILSIPKNEAISDIIIEPPVSTYASNDALSEPIRPTLPTYGISHLDYYIDHLTESLDCPRDYVTCAVMTAIAASGGAYFTCYDGRYSNNAMFYMAIVGNQSANKSAPIRQALKPLRAINEELYHTYIEERDSVNTDDNKQPKPIRKQLIVQDVTPEVLELIMVNNERGVCLVADELATRFNSIDRYRNGSGISPELSIFSNEQLSTNRMSREGFLVERPYLTQIGSIQPNRLVDFFGSKEWISSGYNARWLFCYPEQRKYQRKKSVDIDENIINSYANHIRNIYDVSIEHKDKYIRFSNEALSLLDDYKDQQKVKASNTEIDYEQGIYEKLLINVQRWSLATYITRKMNGNAPEFIDADCVRYAIECMGYFEYMAFKVKNKIETDRGNIPTEVLTKESVIKNLVAFYPEISKSQLAKVIGVSQPYISKVTNRR